MFSILENFLCFHASRVGGVAAQRRRLVGAGLRRGEVVR